MFVQVATQRKTWIYDGHDEAKLMMIRKNEGQVEKLSDEMMIMRQFESKEERKMRGNNSE